MAGAKRASDYRAQPKTRHPKFTAPSHGYILMMPPELLPDTSAPTLGAPNG